MEFEKGVKRLLANKASLIAKAKEELAVVENAEPLEAEKQRIIDKIEELTSKSADDVTVAKVKRLENKLDRVEAKMVQYSDRAVSLRWYIETLEGTSEPKYSPEAWQGLVDHAVANEHKRVFITWRYE